ncbi:hypothetical protein AVEN_173890-1 [Araneus ventricosus]|uniref:Uncharacterized protein n=1 Tax=Araneus ventricosus TaxID=182803 RepID=A0A4Y2ISJ8_ARAVE|nr:hypothetical protein AVEN_173890-1 [Araneus ventricosus]
MVCSDRKQCRTPTRHGINEVIIEGLGNSTHSCRRELYNCGIVSLDDKRSAALLPRMSQTCSIGLMSGEYACQSIRRIPSSKKKLPTCRARCGLALSSMRMDSFPIAAAFQKPGEKETILPHPPSRQLLTKQTPLPPHNDNTSFIKLLESLRIIVNSQTVPKKFSSIPKPHLPVSLQQDANSILDQLETKAKHLQSNNKQTNPPLKSRSIGHQTETALSTSSNSPASQQITPAPPSLQRKFPNPSTTYAEFTKKHQASKKPHPCFYTQ